MIRIARDTTILLEEGLLSFPIITKQAHMQEDEEQQQQVEKR
jgi:hypothetical protein